MDSSRLPFYLFLSLIMKGAGGSMRLKTKLVVAATCLTFAIVVVLSLLFLAELLRQRVAQTAASNEVVARQLLMMTRQAVEVGLRADPPADRSDAAFHAAVADALASYQPLLDTMDGVVRYSPAVQDVSVVDAQGMTLASTDPTIDGKAATNRMSFNQLENATVFNQARQVFGKPQLLEVSLPLARNGQPFLTVRVGVRSTFLKNNYLPSLRDALLLVLLCGCITVAAAALLANMALVPIEEISRRLELLAAKPGEKQPLALPQVGRDAVVRVARTIQRLGEQMQETEAGYTDLQANLTQMLDTLRDGVLLFTGENRAAIVSDAVANFVGAESHSLVGRELTEIFKLETALGRAVLDAFDLEVNVTAETVALEDGRVVEISVDHIDHGKSGRIGTLLTLHDAGSAMKLEKELEVSRRLAAVGRLTAGVGHEVKNPINAMVVHLELLRGKLAADPESANGAQRHVEILAGEMDRLDRVVQTLADFTRPLELQIGEVDLAEMAQSVLDLMGAEMAEHGVRWECDAEPVIVYADGELLRQALLNLVLNGMQSMDAGGMLRVTVRRVDELAVVTVEDEGSGIAPELMPRIFELYFTTKAAGSGIGLAMTYRILQMHGGAVEVQSQVGRGTVFTMRLPAAYTRSAEARRRVATGITTGRAGGRAE
jgi:signal transduction histidine kinase